MDATYAASLFERAADRIEDPERWTQDATARDKNRKRCTVEGDQAVMWCAWGALYHEASRDDPCLSHFQTCGVIADALSLMNGAPGLPREDAGESLVLTNDTIGHREVVRMLRTFSASVTHPKSDSSEALHHSS